MINYIAAQDKVEITSEEEARYLAVIKERHRPRKFFKENPVHSPPIQPIIGNIPVHPRECQGGQARYKESILEFAKRSNCDTIITLSCHRNVSYDALKSFVENVVHKAQNTYAKRRGIYVNMTFFVERVPGNTHVHGLLSFPSTELRERFWEIFPLTDAASKAERRACRLAAHEAVEDPTKGEFVEIKYNKSEYWSEICESGTYDLQMMNDKDAAIKYAQKEQDRNVDYDLVLHSTDFVTSGSKPKAKPRYPKIKK